MRECLFRFWMGRWTRELLATALILFACSSADASVPGVETGPTNSISGLTQTSVNLMGGITNLGGTTVTNAGFFLNTNSTATNGVKYSAPGSSFLVGPFSNTITGLTPGTSYYYRAFAVNSVGTGYGANEYSFTTPSPSPFTYTTSTAGVTITGYTGTGGAVEIPATIGGVAVTTIGQNAFQSQSNVTAVVIPSGVTAIMDAAFAGCSGMTAITLPNSLTSIGNYAFDGCSSLQSITIPDGVTSIGANAFSWCTSMPSITLPSGLNKIVSGTFWSCTNLTSITIPSSVNEIQYNAFLNCSKLASVNFLGNTPPTFGNPTPFGGIATGAKGYYPATASAAWSGRTITGLSLIPLDTQSPVITLNGANPMEIYKGATFSDPGATVTDNVDATRTITGSGTVNTATLGNYTLKYNATDAAANLAVEVTRTVVVTSIPATITLSTESGYYRLLQGAVPLDDRLTVSGEATFSGATIQIETGFASGDTLSLTPSIGGITGIYDGTKGILTLSGSGSASAYQSALRAVTFSTTSTSTVARGFKVTLGSAISFGGHYYEYVPGSYSWAGARTLALSKTFNGLSGYLANLTSADENSFVKTKIGADVWIGGSDEGTEGVWKWMDGPEAGITFWNGLSNGSAPSGSYANWNSGEPNQAGDEDYAQFYVGTGKWNDLPSGSRLGFLVEYGTDTAAIQTFSGTRIFSVTKAMPTITAAPTAATISYGQTLGSSTLSGGSGSVSGRFDWANSAALPSAGTANLEVTFTPKDTANYNTVTTSVNVTVNKATPSIATAPTSIAIGYGQTLGSSTLSGGAANVPGSFAWTTPSTLPNAGTASQGVTFTPADKDNYNTVTTNVSVTVNKATPSITVAPAATSISYGQTLAQAVLNSGKAMVGGNEVGGLFSFDSVSLKPGAGTAQQNVTFTPNETDKYNPVVLKVLVMVERAILPTVTITAPASLVYSASAKTHTAMVTGPSSLTLTYTGRNGTTYNSTTAPTTVGDYTVTVTTSDANYSGLQVQNFSITTKPVTIAAEAKNKKYGETDPALTYRITSGALVGIDALTGGLSRIPGERVGTYAISSTLANANYDVMFEPANLTIEAASIDPASITVTSPLNLIYDGTRKVFAASRNDVSGFIYSYEGVAPTGYAASNMAPTDAGTYRVTARSSDSNYIGSKSVNFTIEKATPTITAAPAATPIAYGQILAFSTLSVGVASVPGSFAWTTPSTSPNAGTASQGVTFTPSDTANYNTAVASVNVMVNAALISSGFSHTLYLGAGASTVTSWGLNTDGRLGVGDTASPVNWAKAVLGIPSGDTVTGLSAGGTHSLILAGGKVYAAGSDRYGQLGQGAVNGASKTSFTPVAIPSSTAVGLAAGGNHSLIVTASGKVFACGDNYYGQLAQPATTASSGTLVEVNFPGLSTKIVSAAAGADHNLAVDENGGVWVWGRNDSGQLGKNTRILGAVADRTPVRIISSGAKSLAAGYAHSLVLMQNGTVQGFGRNTLGQTGQSSGTSYAKLPTQISGLSGIRSIAAGTDSSFAIAESGQLYSWGYNSYGELLLGYASPAVYGPTQSPVCRNVFNVSGGGYSSLAVGAQGVIFGGRNDVGQAGNGPDPDQVVGDYYYGSGNLPLSNLTMDLAGTTETLYDQIFIGNGAVTLNGILNLMFVGTYTGPVYGSTQTFDLIWAKNGIVLGTGYQLAFNQAGYLVESAVADKIVEGVSGKVLQATVRAVVTAADLAKAVNLANPSLDGVESVSYGASTGIRALSVSTGVEMIYSYKRPTGGVSSGAQYFVNGITYRVEQVSSLTGAWGDASVSGTTVTPLGNGYERATLRISASGSAGFLRLTTETPQATGIGAGVGSAVTL